MISPVWHSSCVSNESQQGPTQAASLPSCETVLSYLQLKSPCRQDWGLISLFTCNMPVSAELFTHDWIGPERCMEVSPMRAAPIVTFTASDGPCSTWQFKLPWFLLPWFPAWSLALQIGQTVSVPAPVRTPSLCEWMWPAAQEHHISNSHAEAVTWMTWNNVSLGIPISCSNTLCVLGCMCLSFPWHGLPLLTSRSLEWGPTPASGL